jgi:hypothetical protein
LAPWSSQPIDGGERHDLGLADHGHGIEVEALQGLAGRQPGFDEVTFDTPFDALGDLVFGEGGEEAGGGPAFLVGPIGDMLPAGLDRGQAQLAEEQGETSGVDRVGRPGHAPAP